VASQPRAAWLQVALEIARHREARALALAGEAACGNAGVACDAESTRAVGDASTLREERDAMGRALAASLDEDRADWVTASPWLKAVIVARGLLVRAVLRARRRRIERDLAPILRNVGSLAVVRCSAGGLLPDDVAAAVEQRRREVDDATARLQQFLEPLGGRALPPWARAGVRQTSRFAIGLGGQVGSRLLPRLPGLAGLAAGWWVAQSFTASRWAAFTQTLGLRRGGPRVVSAETYQRLEFWVPLLSAALCAYAASRLGALLERRYGHGRDVEADRRIATPPPR
jgi:hypothetical protein